MNADVLPFRSRKRTRLEIALWILKQTCWRGVKLTDSRLITPHGGRY